jgi:hypothetical protein
MGRHWISLVLQSLPLPVQYIAHSRRPNDGDGESAPRLRTACDWERIGRRWGLCYHSQGYHHRGYPSIATTGAVQSSSSPHSLRSSLHTPPSHLPHHPSTWRPLPLSSLLGSIIQFVDAGGKMIKMAHDIRKPSSGMIKENESLQELARQIRALSIRMEPSSTGSLSPDQSDLQYLARQCRQLSEEMLRLVKVIQVSGSKSVFETWTAVLSSYKYKDAKKELEQKLQTCRNLLQLQCNKMIRYS